MGRRLTEWLRLESISEEHLIQGFCSGVVRYSRFPRIVSGWVLRMYTDISVCSHWTLVRTVSIFLYFSHKLFLHIYNVPQNPLFSRMNSPISTFLCQVFQPFNISALVCWIRSTLLDSHCRPPSYWWVQNWPQHSRCISQVLSRGEGSPPSMCRQNSYKWVPK